MKTVSSILIMSLLMVGLVVAGEQLKRERPIVDKLTPEQIEIAIAAESNLVELAQILGSTNIPVQFTKVYATVYSMVKSTNQEIKINGLALGSQVDAQLNFFVLNGGNAWKVGLYELRK